MARRSKKSTTSLKVNFKGVESRKTPPEGDYVMKVLEAKTGQSQAGNDQIEFVCEITRGEFKGVKGYLYCGLEEKVLWKLHAFLTALGIEVPEDELEVDLPELVDLEFVGVMSHETYNGKKRAKLTDFDSLENYDGDDADEDEDEDEDEKPKKGKKSKSKDDGKKSKKSKKSDDDEDDGDEDDDEDEKPAKGKKSKAPAKSKSKKSKDDEDEDEDEDEKPAKGKKSKSDSKGKKSKKKTYDRDEVEDMDEDELQELLEEAGLDDEVDLDDYKKLPKKVAAVIEALEGADLLDD
jgi:hypothetical protein